MAEVFFLRTIKGMTDVPSITRRLKKQEYRDLEIKIMLRWVGERLKAKE